MPLLPVHATSGCSGRGHLVDGLQNYKKTKLTKISHDIALVANHNEAVANHNEAVTNHKDAVANHKEAAAI